MGFGFRKYTPGPLPYLNIGVLLFFALLGIGLAGKILALPLGDSSKFVEKIDTFLVATSGISKDWSSVAYTASQAIKTKGESLTPGNVQQALSQIHSSQLDFILPYFNHPELLASIKEGASFDDDILSLLGFSGPQTYIIALQNTGEKRPNGGFFGSFALLTLDQGKVLDIDIQDSYLPGYDKPGTSITGPQWLQEFLPDRVIHFIGANKIGFTYHDGGHIKTLYEKSYPGKKIRGVIFVTTDLFEQLIPDFYQQLQERQFTNAAVDLIRGEDRRGKKEQYISGSQQYFKDNIPVMATNFLKNIEQIRGGHYINMYLTDISGPFHGYLRRNNLTTRFEKDTMYFRDSNISFNKIDRFVQKDINCNDETGALVGIGYYDRVDVSSWAAGTYTCTLTYTLDVPEKYIQHMHKLEKTYDIELTSREKHILGLSPQWHTRTINYFDQDIEVVSVDGDGYETYTFATPFSNALTYKVWLGGEQTSKKVIVTFKK